MGTTYEGGKNFVKKYNNSRKLIIISYGSIVLYNVVNNRSQNNKNIQKIIEEKRIILLDTKETEYKIKKLDESINLIRKISSVLDDVEECLSNSDYLLFTDSEKNRLAINVGRLLI